MILLICWVLSTMIIIILVSFLIFKKMTREFFHLCTIIRTDLSFLRVNMLRKENVYVQKVPNKDIKKYVMEKE